MSNEAGDRIIEKARQASKPSPKLPDYPRERTDFSWQQARQELGITPDDGINIALLAVDRHVDSGRGDQTAIRWSSRTGKRKDYSYAQLQELTCRFASVLQQLGIGRGEVIVTLCGRQPEFYISMLGSLRNGNIVCPLFASFGPEPIRARLELGRAKVLVTTERLYRRKIETLRSELPGLQHVLLIDSGSEELPGTRRLEPLLAAADPRHEPAITQASDPALLHFTSGTTGTPKGALHVHEAVLVQYVTGKWVLDLGPDDTFWCTADPGWVTGTSYGVVAPLVNGVTLFVDEAEFEVDRWYANLADHEVNVWYTAPTAVRLLMKFGSERASRWQYPELRLIASVGEPLNPQAVWWGREVFGLPIHDTWWQTETGAIMVANYPAVDIKPGSMGLPLPGIETGIARRLENGDIEIAQDIEAHGELVIRRGWPSMFQAYLGDDERYAECFTGDWYLTGDLARRDGDGYYWFIGRSDDAIQAAGHLIGPFEVENVLMEHPAVAEVGAIGLPDPIAHEVVHAFVTLKPGATAADSLRQELIAHARKRLGPAVAPKQIRFRSELPMTGSGKILRRVLREQELEHEDR